MSSGRFTHRTVYQYTVSIPSKRLSQTIDEIQKDVKVLAYTVSNISEDGLRSKVRIVVDDVTLGRELDLYISLCIPIPRKVAPIPRPVSYIASTNPSTSNALSLLYSATQASEANIVVYAAYPTFDGGIIFYTSNIAQMEKLVNEL